MKILNRKEFFALEGQHVFAKYSPCFCGDLEIKVDNSGRDFVTQSLSPEHSIEHHCGEEFLDLMVDMENDSSIDEPMDYYCYGRDGMYEDDQMFAVLSTKDVKDLIIRLEEVVGGPVIEDEEGAT